MSLRRRVGRDIAVSEDDTLAIKTALGRMGLYREPKYGLTPYPDEAMFDGLRALQIRLGEDPSGSIRPGGPEEEVLFAASSGEASRSDGASGDGTVHVREHTRAGTHVSAYDRNAPGGGGHKAREINIHSPIPGGALRGKDRYGSGAYGAGRKNIKGGYDHQGVDVVSLPGQDVVSPVAGQVVRIAQPYGDTNEYKGVEIEAGNGTRVKVFYVDPKAKVGDMVSAGDVIGYDQDITTRYPGITNHVHVEVRDSTGIQDPTPYLRGD